MVVPFRQSYVVCHFLWRVWHIFLCHSLANLSYWRLLVFYYRSLSNNNSPQVSRTLLSILADHDNAVIRMNSILPLIFPQLSFQSFWNSCKRNDLSWYHPAVIKNPQNSKLIFSCLLPRGLVFWPRLSDPFVPKNHREFYASYSFERILVCACTIW